MDWLFYLGGCWLTYGILNGLIKSVPKYEIFQAWMTFITWTMVWVWFCWRFVK